MGCTTLKIYSPAMEAGVIRQVAALPLQPFQFGQYEGKRRVASLA